MILQRPMFPLVDTTRRFKTLKDAEDALMGQGFKLVPDTCNWIDDAAQIDAGVYPVEEAYGVSKYRIEYRALDATPTRRRFLTVAAVGSIVGVGSLAVAAMAPNDVPQAVTLPKDSGFQADPIYEVIERHRKAALAHTEAVHIKFAFEEHGMQGEKLAEYKRLDAVADAAWNEMDDVGRDLINTLPTTLAGILALCQYIEPIFAEDDQPDLPEYLTYDDDTTAYPAEAFAYVIGKSLGKLMKAEGTVS